jgi:hypothetical protein
MATGATPTPMPLTAMGLVAGATRAGPDTHDTRGMTPEEMPKAVRLRDEIWVQLCR